MMNLILSGLVGMLLASTVVYKRRCNMYKKSYEQAMVLANQSIADAKTAMDSTKTAIEGYELMKHKYESLKAEHAIIFNNLEEDPMCLVKTKDAFNDVCNALFEDDITINKCGNNNSAFVTAVSANLVYDSTSANYYNVEDKEITISMFDDMKNEQGLYLYEHLNNKFGVKLDSSDIRTRFIFTVLHELGHYVDYSNKEVSGEIESYEQQDKERRLALDEIEDIREAWKAYRELPAEAFADKFAVDFMIKHFPELV